MQPLWKTVWRFLKKTKNRVTIWSSNPTPGHVCGENYNSKRYVRGIPGGAVIKNLPANAGDIGSSPGPGRSHIPWSN